MILIQKRKKNVYLYVIQQVNLLHLDFTNSTYFLANW